MENPRVLLVECKISPIKFVFLLVKFGLILIEFVFLSVKFGFSLIKIQILLIEFASLAVKYLFSPPELAGSTVKLMCFAGNFFSSDEKNYLLSKLLE